jgi:hypothetical protein
MFPSAQKCWSAMVRLKTSCKGTWNTRKRQLLTAHAPPSQCCDTNLTARAAGTTGDQPIHYTETLEHALTSSTRSTCMSTTNQQCRNSSFLYRAAMQQQSIAPNTASCTVHPSTAAHHPQIMIWVITQFQNQRKASTQYTYVCIHIPCHLCNYSRVEAHVHSCASTHGFKQPHGCTGRYITKI